MDATNAADIAATALPDLAAHRSEKRRRVASEAIESTGMQLGRIQMLHHARRPSLMQRGQLLFIGGDADK